MCIASDKPVTFLTEGNSQRSSDGVMKKYSTEMNVTAKIDFTLNGDSGDVIKIAMGISETADDAIEAADRILMTKDSAYSRTDRLAAELGLTTKDIEQAMSYISGLVYITADRKKMARAIITNNAGKEGLWRFGISGDIPIFIADIKDESKLEDAMKLVKQYILLSENGLQFDLVLLISDNGDYRTPIKQAIQSELLRLGRDYKLGTFGGVHLVDKAAEGADMIEAMANKIAYFNEE